MESNWVVDLVVLDEQDYELVFENVLSGCVCKFYFFGDNEELLNKCRQFLELSNKDTDFTLPLSDCNGGTDIEVKSGRVVFSGARYGKGGLDDFCMSFSVPKQPCIDGFTKLHHFLEIREIINPIYNRMSIK